ncbi:Phenylacrylic acid decarboxylase [Fusarium acutatum]|uniref:Flavin prenyltransferase PAD1, mitochondrial n=1 Tax=Fusarium acutatum TaxID=78861 RepID=A0A8H4JRR5_9HYPO|nr:Phenylacrylic acid decarboxylase [Fusarium acutatum]
MGATVPQQQQPLTASAETPNVCSAEIDRILRQRRKRHESRSCVPCKRRKVRCDSQTPCATCQKREHPEICVYEASRPSRRTARVQTSLYNQGTPTNPARLDSHSDALRVPHDEENNRLSSPSQDYSITSIAGEKAQKQTDAEELARDVGYVLGLQNSLTSYPFMDLASSTERWCELLKIIPHRQEILSLFPIFQMRVFPFNPLLVDMDKFELDMYGYLRAYTAGEFKSTTISNDWGKERAIGLISLILAVLSSAAHFSDLTGSERSRTCYDLGQTSYGRILCSDLGCQDLELTYHGFMRAICRISTTVLGNDSCYVASVTIDMLEQLDSLHRKTKPYLQDPSRCKSSLEHLQHLALKMHKCFLVTFLCRPEIRNANRSSNQSPIVLSEQQLRIRRRAEDNLVEATKTFLEFMAVSAVPLRSWSMVHTALSSVLLLCIWEETRVKPECRYLREKVIEAFSSPEFNVPDDPASADGNTQWLSPKHIHALVTLKDAFTADESGLQVDYNAMQGWNNADLVGQSGFIPGIIDAWDPFAEYAMNDFHPSVPCDPGATNMELPAMDPSPTNYLDFILRGVHPVVFPITVLGILLHLPCANRVNCDLPTPKLTGMFTSTNGSAPEAGYDQSQKDKAINGSQEASENAEHTYTNLSTSLNPHSRRKRIVVGITGATGAILGIKILIALRRLNIESHLIISKWAEATIKYETDYSPKNVRALADYTHNINDMAAPVSSGSFKTDGMIVVPCSMKTLSAISSGYCDDLISRTADVMLKERRKLVLVARETPLSDIHLRNMLSVTQSGAIIFPPVPAYYIKASSIDGLTDQTVGRVLDLFDLDTDDFERWEGWKRTT